ncbi:MAG TPA: ABC transporter permease [Anaeromyxobacter sp.]
MELVSESLSTALGLIAARDGEVFAAVRISLGCALASTAIAATVGIPIGTCIAIRSFRLKRAVVTLLNTLLALPTVVIGLVLYGVLSRSGPLGGMGLLFTPTALVIGQTVLALPVVVSYAVSAVQGADARILPTALTLGCGQVQTTRLLLGEVKFAIVAAVVAAFGRVISEVGVAMMLGGNIRTYTRTMTTAIALETSKGELAFGLALGVILVGVALVVNMAFNHLQQAQR